MIDVIDIYKSFNGKLVLAGTNLHIKKGESMVVIGGSGSGKSVLMKHVIGLLRPDRGRVLVNEEDLSKMDDEQLNEMRKMFGMLFQMAALFDSMTVGDNVGFALKQHSRLPQKEIDKKVAEKLKLVGLVGIERLRPAELSGGMKKRVGLARAIAMEPQIILYDEPTTGLDPIMADMINDLIIDLHKKLNITSMTITHDMFSAYKIADRIAMLYKGKIIETGTPHEIKNSPNPVVQQFITGSAVGPITKDYE